MSEVSDLAITPDHPLLKSPVAQEMIRQLRALDTYGTYEGWSEARILDPFIVTKERAREIPVIGDPDEIVLSRVKAYYNGISCLIEQRTGRMAAPTVQISHEGFGKALIVVGRLVVIFKTLRDVHRFGFRTIEKLDEDTTQMVDQAVALIEQFPEVADL